MGQTLYIETENGDLYHEFVTSNFWHLVIRDVYGYISEMISTEEQESILWVIEPDFSPDAPLDHYIPVLKDPASFGKIMNKIRENFAGNPEQYMCYAGGYDGTEYDLPAIEIYERDFIAIEKCCEKAMKDGCNIVLCGYD